MIPKGVWHQFGHNSQTLALEQLSAGVGVGVIISPRDLKLALAEERCDQYRALGASVLLDQQFYIPNFTNDNLSTYSTNDFRNSINTLKDISPAQLDSLSSVLEDENRRLGAAAVVAPAVLYEANHPERLHLNTKLFDAAKRAGDTLGVPTLATVVLGHSVIVSPKSISDALGHATGLDCGGWYFAFEFTDCRLPCEHAEILSCGSACLTLATNLKPVIHAYAGPMSLLSFGFGATGAAIGHSQTLWQFDRARWPLAPVESQGGPGRIPPRFFSATLWGTIVYSDEVVRLPPSLRNEVMTHSPHSELISDPSTHGVVNWSRHAADKHLVHVIGTKAAELASLSSSRASAQAAIEQLNQANALFAAIANVPLLLRQESLNTYQPAWRAVLERLLGERSDDYDYLEMMS